MSGAPDASGGGRRSVLRRLTVGALLPAGVATVFAAPSPARAQTMDDAIYTYVLADVLEYAGGAEERPVEYEALAWIGGDYHRLWLKARGEQSTRERAGDFEGQALYGRTVTAFWSAQVGVRVDRRYGGEREAATRGLLALGMEGLAPYWFDVEPFLYVSQDGAVSARLEASYDLLFTQRLILQPDIELNAAVQEVPEFGIGSGLNDVELAARLRYEFVREFAPYVGFSWLRRTGETANLARAQGKDVSDGSFVAGLRWWY